MNSEAKAKYGHYDKFVEPDKNIEIAGSTLKWYNLAKTDEPVPDEIRDLARSFLENEAKEGNIEHFGELGFVILHRCGHDFYFLLVNSWRNGNEVWESVYAKDGEGQVDFAKFPAATAALHHPTYCVWELAAVWHEQQAFKRFLFSDQDDRARTDYIEDRYRGPA